MGSASIHALTMPKWGLAMTEGRIAAWLLEEGVEIIPGSEVVDVETEKIVSALESPYRGVLRRKIARPGESVPVGGLVAVIADPSVPDTEIDTFVVDFQSKFVPAEAIEQVSGPQPQTLEVNGLRLRYLKRGEGRDPALLLHGFGGDLNTWLFNHEALAQERAVYALDIPGHGGSVKTIECSDLRDFARIVLAFLDAVGLKRVHIAGHSMGGAIALSLAAAEPDRVSSLSLIASAGLGEEIDSDYIEGFISASRRRDMKPVLERLFAQPSLLSHQLIDDVLKYKRMDGVASNLRSIATAFFPQGRQRELLRDSLVQISAPVIVIFGSEDRIIPAAHAENLPDSVTKHILPGAGHMVQMEAAVKINRLLENFWKDHALSSL
jgi:pyruvate dehydrogenase E2 component (dihydrolipoamide acetyltransferase)